mmetsp:Transcript_34394/g.83221  ORF Transcript_34394/g.83221 Transcript_34394/m.83221 type:complete len:231 (-) Transcript_34394:64-756(-)
MAEIPRIVSTESRTLEQFLEKQLQEESKGKKQDGANKNDRLKKPKPLLVQAFAGKQKNMRGDESKRKKMTRKTKKITDVSRRFNAFFFGFLLTAWKRRSQKRRKDDEKANNSKSVGPMRSAAVVRESSFSWASPVASRNLEIESRRRSMYDCNSPPSKNDKHKKFNFDDQETSLNKPPLNPLSRRASNSTSIICSNNDALLMKRASKNNIARPSPRSLKLKYKVAGTSPR